MISRIDFWAIYLAVGIGCAMGSVDDAGKTMPQFVVSQIGTAATWPIVLGQAIAATANAPQ